MLLMLQIRDIAVALRIGLALGRVGKTPTPDAQNDPPASAEEPPCPAPKRYPVGFQRNGEG
ncbi:hypothetical protein SEA_AMYEV_67 [Arthrobacter phage Amyev]|uniref:Uncharacterized protein n=1 Tax=Arthrobacter phage Amyev TaxID=2832315 RepID=A0AA48Y3X7_9CAUD|nr:hypothetical protein PQD88_gp67 [Arthrobacter phage Amyev]UIW13482.1 hypothetical protein SEA_AMYEV_67 [Arthrobacter phage Amyev]